MLYRFRDYVKDWWAREGILGTIIIIFIGFTLLGGFIQLLPPIALEKTVGTNSEACATTNTTTIDAGTDVYYCYQVTNTGAITVANHHLVDDKLGGLVTDISYQLGPGEQVIVILNQL